MTWNGVRTWTNSLLVTAGDLTNYINTNLAHLHGDMGGSAGITVNSTHLYPNNATLMWQDQGGSARNAIWYGTDNNMNIFGGSSGILRFWKYDASVLLGSFDAIGNLSITGNASPNYLSLPDQHSVQWPSGAISHYAVSPFGMIFDATQGQFIFRNESNGLANVLFATPNVLQWNGNNVLAGSINVQQGQVSFISISGGKNTQTVFLPRSFPDLGYQVYTTHALIGTDPSGGASGVQSDTKQTGQFQVWVDGLGTTGVNMTVFWLAIHT